MWREPPVLSLCYNSKIPPLTTQNTTIGDATAAIDLYLKLKDRRIDFTLQRFQELDQIEKATVWKIRILHPNKRIDRCNVWLDDMKLRLWNSPDATIRTIEEGGGANFVVPESISIYDDSKVIIKAFNKKIRSEKFSDIEISKP